MTLAWSDNNEKNADKYQKEFIFFIFNLIKTTDSDRSLNVTRTFIMEKSISKHHFTKCYAKHQEFSVVKHSVVQQQQQRSCFVVQVNKVICSHMVQNLSTHFLNRYVNCIPHCVFIASLYSISIATCNQTKTRIMKIINFRCIHFNIRINILSA